MPAETIKTPSVADAPAVARRMAWFVTVSLWIGILLAYREQVALVLESWETMPSHAHGYVVLLVVAYLVWGKRHTLAAIPQAPSLAGLAAFAVSGAAALLGELVSAASVVQFSIVFMIESAVWTVMGGRIFRILFGPLNFLFFAIPFGHDVLPTLMDWTANATVLGLRASGVPVFQENRHFIIPSGSWSVVEACAGVRYLLTSFFVGSIFAYITYNRWHKRVAFVVSMLLLSLFANWLRAYVIVMVAHLSNNQWGLGLSHLAVGWVIFAVVVALSFVIGLRWADPEPRYERGPAGIAATLPLTAGHALLAGVILVGLSLTGHRLLHPAPRPAPVLDFSGALGGLEATEPSLPMITPQFVGASAMHAATYRFRGGEIGLTVAYYRDQRQGAELINVNNLIEPTHTWTWAKSARLAGTRDGIPDLRVEHYARREVNAVAATVYWVGGRTTVSDSLSKLYQAVNLLSGRGDDAAVLVITASRPVQEEDALPLVDAFVRERLPRLLENLDIIRAGPLRAPRPNP